MARLGGAAVIAAALALAALPAATAGPADGQTLAFDVRVLSTWDGEVCPAGVSATTDCFHYTAQAVVPGLGSTSWAWDETVDRGAPAGGCGVWTIFNGSWATPRGTLTFTGASEGCPSLSEGAGVTLQIQFTASATADFGPANVASSGESTEFVQWTGSLAIPGVSFDTTPPVLTGAKSGTVTVRAGHGARVRFSVRATDAVDGNISVSCQPRSGSFFPIGRTLVTCTATDKSGNTNTARFTVTVNGRSISR